MALKKPFQDDGSTHQYSDKLPSDIARARKVLETYSGIEPDKVVPHILQIHDKASKHSDPYPCITSFRFLQFHLSYHPLYDLILTQLSARNSTKTLLDLGTCFGQDLRILAHDGAPTSHLFGVDLHPELIELGFELFNDRDRLGENLIAADIFAETSELDRLHGKMDYITANAFLHLFSWEEQVRVCTRMVAFLKPLAGEENGDSTQQQQQQQQQQIIFGRQSATTNPGPRVREVVTWGQRELYLHNDVSFQRLWEEVGRRTGTTWEVRAELRGLGNEGVKGIEETETARLLVFSVWRWDRGGGRGEDGAVL